MAVNWESHDNSQPFPDDERALKVLGRLPDPRPEPEYWAAGLLNPGPARSAKPEDNRGLIRGAIWGLIFSIFLALAAIVVVKAVLP